MNGLRTWIALLAASLAIQANAQFPDKPVRIVVAYGAGGAADTQARLLAKSLSAQLGQPFVVDNRPGAAGMLSHNEVSKSAADGYTLLYSAAGPLTVTPHVYEKLPYDPKGFEPIKLISKMAIILVVGPSVKATSVSELVASLRSSPGKMSYGSFGNGSAAHLAGEQFKMLAGVDVTHVPYKGTPPVWVDLVGGRIDMKFAVMSNAAPQIRAGKVRALAIASATRSPAFPDVPTMEEVSIKNFVSDTWFGLLAPRGTPPQVVAALSKAGDTALANEEFRTAIVAMGAVPGGGSPEDFRRFFDAEFVKWGKVVDVAGIRASAKGQ